jgi:hypothetical protein
MSNCNPFKISLKSPYSYNDLTDLPSINGVKVRGDLSLESLGLDTWLADNTRDFLTQNDIDSMGFVTETELNSKGFVTNTELGNKGFVTETELNGKGFVTESDLEQHLSEFIVNDSAGGVNRYGFTIEENNYGDDMVRTVVSTYQISIGQSNEAGDMSMGAYVTPYSVSVSQNYSGYYSSAEMSPDGSISFYDSYGSATLDLYTLQALIALLG